MPKVQKQPKQNPSEEGHYGLSDIAEKSGVTRDMVNYYLRSGLLPKPEKLRANRSIYTEQHLALILLVLRFQNEAHLSLNEITQLFKSHQHDPASLELEFLAGTFNAKPDTKKKNKSPVENLQLPADFLRELKSQGLIDDSEKPSASERRVAALILRGKASGLTTDFFIKAQTAVRLIVDAEKASLVKTLKTEQEYSELRKTLLEVDQIVNRWLSTEKKRQIEKKSRDRNVASLEKLSHYVYQPSDAFIEKYGINDYIGQLKSKLGSINEQEPQPHETQLHETQLREQLLQVLFLIGDHTQCEVEALTLLDRDEKNIKALCTMAHLNCIEGNIDLSTQYADTAAKLDKQNGTALCLLAFTNILQSTHASGIISPMKYVNKAIKLFETNETIKQSTYTRVENALISVHAYGVQKNPDITSAESKLFDYVISSLDNVIARLTRADKPKEPLPFPGYIELTLIRAHFYLSEFHEQVGNLEQARLSQKEVIRLDPMSNFGSSIFMKQ